MPRFYSRDLPEHVWPLVKLVYEGVAKPATKRLAEKIVLGIPDTHVDGFPAVEAYGLHCFLPELGPPDPEDWTAPIRRIWGFVVLNIAYAPDPPDFELNMSLELSLDAGEGDCDDMVIALATLLKVLDYKVEGRVVSTDGSMWTHIYLRVFTPLGWMALDPTVRGAVPGWEYASITDAGDFKI